MWELFRYYTLVFQGPWKSRVLWFPFGAKIKIGSKDPANSCRSLEDQGIIFKVPDIFGFSDVFGSERIARDLRARSSKCDLGAWGPSRLAEASGSINLGMGWGGVGWGEVGWGGARGSFSISILSTNPDLFRKSSTKNKIRLLKRRMVEKIGQGINP